MKHRNILVAGLLAFVLGLAVPTYRPTDYSSPPALRTTVSQVDGPPIVQTLNRFERAQRQTVLLKTSDGQGSAVILKRVNRAGNIRFLALTAAHVVENDEFVDAIVTLRTEGRKVGAVAYQARVLHVDTDWDLALLFIDAPPDAFLGAEFASPEPARVGDPVFSVGNFFGSDFDGSVSEGIVSQIGVNPGRGFPWKLADQVDCAAFPGSSGAALFNAQGRVLGIIVGGRDSALVWVVPVRAIFRFAEQHGITRSVVGDYAPENVEERNPVSTKP